MQRPRVKTSVKQRPRGPGSRRCGACGHAVSAGDKFCTGCGKPLTSVAPAAAPQKQRPKTKTKPAAPRMKKRKPKTVPPRMKKRKPITVPAAAPQAQKQKTMVVPAMSEQEQKQYLENVPEWWYCGRCGQKVLHSEIKCPKCGLKWKLCRHKDGKYYKPEECIAYHEWVVWSKSQAGN